MLCDYSASLLNKYLFSARDIRVKKKDQVLVSESLHFTGARGQRIAWGSRNK